MAITTLNMNGSYMVCIMQLGDKPMFLVCI